MRLFIFLFTCAVLIPAVAFAETSGVIDLLPGPPSVDVHPRTLPSTMGLPHPGVAARKETRPDTVQLLFPQDLAKFLPGSIVTLGWRPPDETIFPYPSFQHPIEYRISVVGEYAPEILIHLPIRTPEVVSHCMVAPPVPGKYRWQIAAIMPDTLIIQSEVRIFTILPWQ